MGMMNPNSPTRYRAMAKANPLQAQLLKAGLVKKSKLAEVARAQHKARDANAQAAPSEIARDAERSRTEKVARDRALAAERKAQARAAELQAQARQIMADKQVEPSGEVEYRFSADGAIRTLRVDDDQRRKLAAGVLVIARLDQRYVLLPRAAGEQVRERDAALVVLDHGMDAGTEPAAPESEDDAYYAQFKVPDDLVW